MKNVVEYQLKKLPTKFGSEVIKTSTQSYEYIKQFYSDDISIYESFFLLLLNRSNTIIGFVKVSQGGISGTVVDPLLVAKYAINSLAKGVILAHNHPSGSVKPSEQDRLLTIKIRDGLKLFDVNVLDHIILAENNYYSFCDEGIL